MIPRFKLSYACCVIAVFTSPAAHAEGPFSQALFSRIDPRSIYGKSTFPEPLLAPEMDVESEARFDWFHSEKSHIRSDSVKGEFEYSIGYLTLELETKYE